MHGPLPPLPPSDRTPQVDLREDSSLVGRTLGEADLRKLVGARVVAVKRAEGREDGALSTVPLGPETRLVIDASSDYLVNNDELLEHFRNVEVIKDGNVKEFVIDVIVTARSWPNADA